MATTCRVQQPQAPVFHSQFHAQEDRPCAQLTASAVPDLLSARRRLEQKPPVPSMPAGDSESEATDVKDEELLAAVRRTERG